MLPVVEHGEAESSPALPKRIVAEEGVQADGNDTCASFGLNGRIL
jgi:hypothetical protein